MPTTKTIEAYYLDDEGYYRVNFKVELESGTSKVFFAKFLASSVPGADEEDIKARAWNQVEDAVNTWVETTEDEEDSVGDVYAPAGTINILWVGQSNASRMFTSFTGNGNREFVETMEEYYETVNSINGAHTGAAIHKDADNGTDGYFWDLDNDLPGQRTLDALQAVEDAGLETVDLIIVVHGERDAVKIDDSTITVTESKNAMLAYLAYLRERLGNPDVLMTPIGANGTSSAESGYGQMRRALWQLWNEEDYIFENPGFWNLEYEDNLHLTEAGYVAFGVRTARRVLGLNNKIPVAGTLGPRIDNVYFDPDTNRGFIHITHDQGTDFEISSRRGNVMNVNGTYRIPVGDIVKISPTAYEVNPGVALTTGDTCTFNWPWGSMIGFSSLAMFRDNSPYAMPLRPAYDLPMLEQGV